MELHWPEGARINVRRCSGVAFIAVSLESNTDQLVAEFGAYPLLAVLSQSLMQQSVLRH